MPITVKVPTQLRSLTGGADEVQAEGPTLRELIESLEVQHPGLKDRLVDAKGVRRFVNIYVGDEDVRFLDGLATRVEGQVVSIVPAIAGGRGAGA